MSQCPGVGHTGWLTEGSLVLVGCALSPRCLGQSHMPCITLRGQKLEFGNELSLSCVGVMFLWECTGIAVFEPGCMKVPAFKAESNQEDL